MEAPDKENLIQHTEHSEEIPQQVAQEQDE